MTAKNEALGVKTVEVEWDGHAYTVPASLDLVDPDAFEVIVEGSVLDVVRALLGAEQWALWKERGRGKPHRFGEFRDAIWRAMGDSEPGESSASSD